MRACSSRLRRLPQCCFRFRRSLGPGRHKIFGRCRCRCRCHGMQVHHDVVALDFPQAVGDRAQSPCCSVQACIYEVAVFDSLEHDRRDSTETRSVTDAL